jgi:hypothetical protein
LCFAQIRNLISASSSTSLRIDADKQIPDGTGFALCDLYVCNPFVNRSDWVFGLSVMIFNETPAIANKDPYIRPVIFNRGALFSACSEITKQKSGGEQIRSNALSPIFMQ